MEIVLLMQERQGLAQDPMGKRRKAATSVDRGRLAAVSALSALASWAKVSHLSPRQREYMCMHVVLLDANLLSPPAPCVRLVASLNTACLPMQASLRRALGQYCPMGGLAP